MKSVRGKLGLQFAVSNGSTLAYFFLSVALSRLLSPTEIGIFSITAVFVGFTQVFRDFGVSAFIKRQKELTPQVLSAATGVLFTTSWTMALVLYLVSGYWARAFNQPGIDEVMPVLALGFFFIPFGAIPQAIYGRSMEVTKTAIATICSTVIYIATCLTLAQLGFSYMSMAWANLAGIVANGLVLMLLKPLGLSLTPSFKGWSSVLHFGAGSMITSAIKAIDMALPDILLGKLSGPHQVGLFSRSNSTVNMINTALAPTVNYFSLPYLSRMHHDGQHMREGLTRPIAYLTVVLWPALTIIAIQATEVISVLYGPAWLECAPTIPWLCAACGVQVVFLMSAHALNAVNRPYLNAWPALLVLAVKAAAGYAMYDGSLASFGMAMLFAELAGAPFQLLIMHKYVGFGLRDWPDALLRSACVCLATGAVGGLLQYFLSNLHSPLLRMVIMGACIVPLWLLAVYKLRHPAAQEFSRFGSLVRRSP